MAYYGARVASMSTSPIAIAVPSGKGPIMFDMATSTISNGKILQARRTRHAGNTAMFVIDIEMLRPLAEFENEADVLAAVVKALPRQAGFDEILLPGERGNRTETVRRKSGIPIPKKLWEELSGIAKSHGVTPLRAAAR